MQVTITRCNSWDLSNNASLLTVKEYFEQYKAGLNTVSELVHKVESVGYGVVSFNADSITIDAEVKVNGIDLLVNFTLTL